ncbi:MAG: hypothetical protein F6K09_34680 [Merismopedia sp. SIO2A8]|nr:hypothetical protein [Merismopedia sp. SIO2A8]
MSRIMQSVKVTLHPTPHTLPQPVNFINVAGTYEGHCDSSVAILGRG